MLAELKLLQLICFIDIEGMVMVKMFWLILIVVLLIEGRDLRGENTVAPKQQPQVVFYRYFTPIKLARAATFIHYHHSVTPRLLTFLGAPKNYYRLMLVPLIPPAFITENANLVIKMTVGMEATFGAADSDPSFVVSDGTHFIGVISYDKTNHLSIAPCVGIEGASGPTMNQQRQDASLPKLSSKSYYPGRFEIQLSLSDRWGTCFVSLDGGFSREMIYQNKLNPRNGLFLEIYGDHAQEKEGIKYIEMTILKEN